jgi:hypothetical protein
LLRIYRDKILPDQVRAYRAIYDRYQKEAQPALPPGVPVSATPAFSDVVVAQQNLAQSIATYVQTLGAMWQAVADVADLIQTDDLFQLGIAGPCPENIDVPDLANLPGLPCMHPCSPLPDPQLKTGDGPWPSAAPALDDPATTLPIERQRPSTLPPVDQKEAAPNSGKATSPPDAVNSASLPSLLDPPPPLPTLPASN